MSHVPPGFYNGKSSHWGIALTFTCLGTYIPQDVLGEFEFDPSSRGCPHLDGDPIHMAVLYGSFRATSCNVDSKIVNSLLRSQETQVVSLEALRS